MCDAILFTLLKFNPSSQSSRENATTSSGTYPLASYKEVPPLDMKTGHEKVLDELSEKQLEMWKETREA